MKLERHDLECYRRDGFVHVEKLFSCEETRIMKAELCRLPRESEQQMNNGVCLGITLASDIFRRVNKDDRVLDILESIIGPDIEFWTDRAVFKGKGARFATPWHQDWQYWRGVHKISVWIAVDEARPEDGCLKLIPGSHRLGSIDHGQPQAVQGEGFRYRLQVDERYALIVPVARGGAVFFDDRTIHGSLPNASGLDRWCLISTYRQPSIEEPAYRGGRCESFIVRGRLGTTGSPDNVR